MNTSNHALVFLWQGKDAADEIISAMAGILVENNLVIPELLKVIYKDEDGIAKALIRDHKQISFKEKEIDDADALRVAIVYIKEKFKNTLSGSQEDMVPFAMAITAAVKTATNKMRRSKDDIALLNSIELIAKNSGARTIALKYNLPPKVVNIIETVFLNI